MTDFTQLIANAETHVLLGALQVALQGAHAEGPIERRESLKLATQINEEISRRA